MANYILPRETTSAASTPHGKAVRIHVLIENYLKSDNFRNLSKNSKKNYLSRLKTLENFPMPDNRSILEYYAHRIDYFKVDHIKRILAYKLSPASIASHFAVFSNVWELAIRNGYLSNNPWEKAKIRINNLREVVWTTEQIKSVIECAKSNGYTLLALYVAMAYSTAQRPYSDLRELKWESFKKDGDRYILDFTISKTNTHLMLPLDTSTSDLLLGMERISEYIFVDEKGKRLSSGGITSQLNKVKYLCGVDPKLTMRDLRRTAVTELAMAGATVPEITAVTGWKCSERVLNKYAMLRLTTADNALTKRIAFQNANTISESVTVLPEPTSAT